MVTEDNFLSLLQEKQHKQVILALSEISTKLASQNLSAEFRLLIEKLANLEIKDKEVPLSITSMSRAIVAKLESIDAKIKPRPSTWEFTVKTNPDTKIIESMTATAI